MSGRDHEPIAAFFPPIDRNLMRDLDRHLRGTSPREPQQEVGFDADEPAEVPLQDHASQSVSPQAAAAPNGRPSTNEVLEAVQQAASSMVAMGQRIEELETHLRELEGVNAQLRSKLSEMLQLQQASEARARHEAERAVQAEQIAAQHLSRAQTLESDLETALGDLHRIAEAITGTLSIHHSR